MRVVALALLLALPVLADVDEALYKSLSEKQARNLTTSVRVSGRVGGTFDRVYYKLRVTWITQDVASALARVLVATKGIREERALSALRALDDNWYYFLVELDPQEGSGVIPKDWVARFGPPAQPSRAVVAELLPETETWTLVASAFPRDYAYDRFLIRVAKKTGDNKTLDTTDSPAELTVTIYEKVGRVHWSMSERRR